MQNFIDPTTSSREKATDSFEMRMQPRVKDRIAHAAELSGVKLATFVRAAAAREAERVLHEHQITLLSERDRRALLAALDNPPAPTEAARDAVRSYRARITDAG